MRHILTTIVFVLVLGSAMPLQTSAQARPPEQTNPPAVFADPDRRAKLAAAFP
jgi:hypothetical protein